MTFTVGLGPVVVSLTLVPGAARKLAALMRAASARSNGPPLARETTPTSAKPATPETPGARAGRWGYL